MPWRKMLLWCSGRHKDKVWRAVGQCIAGLLILSWLLWTYQRPVLHAVRFIVNNEYRECVHRRRNYEMEEQSSPLYVTLTDHGRLGNWMFGYASLLGIAKANGYTPYLLSSHPLSTYFSLTKLQNRHAECLYTVYDDLPCTYNPEFMNLAAGNVSIDGYIQSWKYFRFMEKEIRGEFRMHNHLMYRTQKEFQKYVGEFLQEGRFIISIHVRRGDVLRPEARKLGFTHAPKSYFDVAMKHMLQRYPFAAFFVTSDDIPWCIANIIPPELGDVFGHSMTLDQIGDKFHVQKKLTKSIPIVFSNSAASWEDFAMLTLCNHSIISVGTFGWWSAWLANGHVVYYKDFPLPGTKVDRETKREDFFPPHWVALSGSTGSSNSFQLLGNFLTVCTTCLVIHLLGFYIIIQPI